MAKATRTPAARLPADAPSAPRVGAAQTSAPHEARQGPRAGRGTAVSPAQRRKAEESREIILRAASNLFSERGYLGASLSDIAAAASMGKSNVLYFYDNKDELWKDAVDFAYLHVNAFLRADEFHTDQPSWRQFEAFLVRYLIACARFPAYVKIPMIEGSHVSWRTEWLAERHLKRDLQWFAEFLKPYVAAGMVPAGRELELQALLGGGGHVLFVSGPLFAHALGRHDLNEAFAAEYARFVVSMIARGAAAGPA